MGRYLKRLSHILIITFLVLYCLIWLFSPLMMRYVINNHGLPKPLFLTAESSIRYNPFTAHLSISHLEMKLNEQNSALKLQTLNAELNLHQLLFDKIYVAEFNLDGIFIPVTVNDSSLNIAGVELRGENSQPSVTTPEVQPNSTEASFPYQVIIPAFNLTNARVEVMHFSQKHTIELDSVSLQDVLLSKSEQDIKLNLISKLDGAPIELAINAQLLQQQGRISIDLKGQSIALASAQTFLPASITELIGEVSYVSKIDIDIAQEQTTAHIKELLVSIDDLHVEQDNIVLDIKGQRLEGENLAIIVKEHHPISVNAMVNFAMNGISARSKDKLALFADIANLSANNIAFQYHENTANVQVERLDVAESQFSKNMIENMPALAAFNQLSVNQFEYTPDLISVNDITLAGLVANVLLDQEKNLATLVAFANNNSNDKARDDASAQSASAVNQRAEHELTKAKTKTLTQPVLKLGQFTLLDAAQINFKDSSVTPHYVRNFTINELLLSDVDSGKPTQEVLLNMQGNSDKYASFDVKARSLPFAIEQQFKVNAVVKELSLPSVSSYIKDALKYEIESGQLDITLDAGLTGNKLNGDVDLLLRGIEFTAADDYETGSLTDKTSVPFNVALGMLKDSDGNVEFSLPLTGDTSSPSFGFSGLLTLLVKQATMSAAKDYLITTFVPYASVMKVAMAAGEFALKLRVNDLEYQAGETDLTPEQLEFSRQMSVMLADRGAINVKLCAIATASDIELTDASQAHLAENITRLNAISQQRVEVFKAYMVEQLKVPSARLLFCTPQIDSSKGAKARIKFVI